MSPPTGEAVVREALAALTRGVAPGERAEAIREMAARLIAAHVSAGRAPPRHLAAIVADPLPGGDG